MEYLGTVLAGINFLMLILYMIPKLKVFRGYVFIFLVLVNSFFLMSDKLIIPMIIMILSFVFEFFLFKISFVESVSIKSNKKINYLIRVIVLFIILGIGSVGMFDLDENKFQVLGLVNSSLSKYDIILLFLTLFLLLNGIIGRKKWIGWKFLCLSLLSFLYY